MQILNHKIYMLLNIVKYKQNILFFFNHLQQILRAFHQEQDNNGH
jgi:hypothetical protein